MLAIAAVGAILHLPGRRDGEREAQLALAEVEVELERAPSQPGRASAEERRVAGVSCTTRDGHQSGHDQPQARGTAEPRNRRHRRWSASAARSGATTPLSRRCTAAAPGRRVRGRSRQARDAGRPQRHPGHAPARSCEPRLRRPRSRRPDQGDEQLRRGDRRAARRLRVVLPPVGRRTHDRRTAGPREARACSRREPGRGADRPSSTAAPQPARACRRPDCPLPPNREASSPPDLLGLFDLDGFKQFNDTFGHPAGDALLVRLGHRLADAMAGRGTAYRIGGDEFCVLMLLGANDPFATGRPGRQGISEASDGVVIECSYGTASIPAEAVTMGAGAAPCRPPVVRPGGPAGRRRAGRARMCSCRSSASGEPTSTDI